MKKDFLGKVVVVTGASAGLGRFIVREFAKHGANIALLAGGRRRSDFKGQQSKGLDDTNRKNGLFIPSKKLYV